MKQNGMQIDLLDAGLEGTAFDFVMEDADFQRIDGLVTRGRICSHIAFTKASESRFLFTIHSEGTVCVPCDRCLADVELRIDTTDELAVQLGDSYDDDGDVLTVPERDGLLDMSLPIYEFVILSMPLRRIHEPGKCDNAMMEVLNRHQAARSSREDAEDDDSTPDGDAVADRPHDSRWDALAKLRNLKT